MDIFKASERLMSMDDATWARHANPWSVGLRFTCLPLIALAIWSRDWIGWWALLPVALSVLWTWWNPRMVGPPKSTDNWASHGVMGERVFLARKEHAIPRHHEVMALILTWASAIGAVILIYGLIALNFWAVMAGMVATILPKLWFVDRMVWLYRDANGVQGR